MDPEPSITPVQGRSVCRVAAVAAGTRGDVQPIALLAHQLACSCPTAHVALITHSCHQGWLDTLGLRLTVIGLPTAPARVWQQDTGQASTQQAMQQQQQQQSEPLHDWDAVLQACCSTLGCSSPSAALSSQGSQQQLSSAQAAKGDNTTLVIFNLFALEAYHISEALQVPCVAAAPYAIPYAMPASFRRRFAAAHPALFQALQGAVGTGSSSVSWAEVQHWMWSLFTERWQAWRQEALGLHPVPLLHAAQGSSGGGRTEGHPDLPPLVLLPQATPLLYGFSEQIVPRPNFYPPSMHTCGFWLPPATPHASLGQTLRGPGGVHALATASPPVCIDFGSMGRMGLIHDAGRLLHVVAQALALVERHGIILAAGWQPLQHAHGCMGDLALKNSLTVVMEAVPHQQLLPHCSVLLHHGGSGSTAAALAAGTPQLFTPLMFDQHFWAERLAYMELAPPPLEQQLLFGTAPTARASDASASFRLDEHAEACSQQDVDAACAALHQRLVFALAPGTQQRCNAVAQALAHEDGLANAVSIIHAFLIGYGDCSEQP